MNPSDGAASSLRLCSQKGCDPVSTGVGSTTLSEDCKPLRCQPRTDYVCVFFWSVSPPPPTPPDQNICRSKKTNAGVFLDWHNFLVASSTLPLSIIKETAAGLTCGTCWLGEMGSPFLPPPPPLSPSHAGSSVKEKRALVSPTTFYLEPRFKDILQTLLIGYSLSALIRGSSSSRAELLAPRERGWKFQTSQTCARSLWSCDRGKVSSVHVLGEQGLSFSPSLEEARGILQASKLFVIQAEGLWVTPI